MNGAPVTQDVIRSARDRILSHTLFAGSPRLSRFLIYVVEEELAGRGDQIKEYAIGATVYERGPDFDPKTDSIVRVEASRLRTKLRRYYESDGVAETVKIELPAGSYVPQFCGPDLALSPASPPPGPNGKSAIRPHWIAAAALASALSLFAGYQLLRPAEPTFSIAVRQFTNLTGDPSLNNTAAALTEQTAVELASDPGILVERMPPAAVSSKAGTTLSGSLSSGDGEYRLTVHLDEAGAGRQLWAATLHRGALSAAQFQDTAAELIARTLNRRYGGRSLAEINRRARHDPAAEEFFVRGHQEWLTQTPRGIQSAISLYDQALERDPKFADAWAEMAAAKLLQMNMVTDPADQARCSHEAQAAAEKALSIDVRTSEAHTRLGNIYLQQKWDFVSAERELRFAVELNPGESATERWLAVAASFRGHSDLARRELQYALIVNPASDSILGEMARLEFEAGRHEQAETLATRALQQDSRYAPAHFLLGLIRERRGDRSAARNEFNACSGTRGWHFDCKASLARLEPPDPGGLSADFIAQFPRHYSRALLHLTAGNRDAASRELESGFQAREPYIHYVCLDPQFSDLIAEGRFAICGPSRQRP